MAERVRPRASGFNEPEGPGSNPGADTEDQTVKLVAISIQWVTAGEFCELGLSRRSKKHWPDLRQKVESIHTAGSGPWNGDERHTNGLAHGATLLFFFRLAHCFK